MSSYSNSRGFLIPAASSILPSPHGRRYLNETASRLVRGSTVGGIFARGTAWLMRCFARRGEVSEDIKAREAKQ